MGKHNKITIQIKITYIASEEPMQITRQADYAVRAVLYLARLEPTQRAATSQVAKEQRIPPSFLAKIISQLSIAGLLHTSRGARGGVTLAREPKEITLLEVIEAIDGPILLNECVSLNSTCTFDEDCPLRPVWCDAQEELVSRLKNTHFQLLLEQSAVAA
jgi:Rrf2 family protein